MTGIIAYTEPAGKVLCMDTHSYKMLLSEGLSIEYIHHLISVVNIIKACYSLLNLPTVQLTFALLKQQFHHGRKDRIIFGACCTVVSSIIMSFLEEESFCFDKIGRAHIRIIQQVGLLCKI